MIIHLFNSSSVSGPERLVLPALAGSRNHFMVVNLREERLEHMREADPLEEYARSLNVEYRDISVCDRWDSVALRHLRTLIERADPDLVHAHDVKASAYLLQIKRQCAKRRFRIVSTHHGVHGRPSLKTRLYESLYRRYILSSFERILCVSSADYDFLLRSGMNPEALRLHLNGIDGYRVEPDQRANEMKVIRAAWLPNESARDDFFLFGVVGRLSAEKDHVRLLRVLSQLNRLTCARPWKCLLIGKGPLEGKLRRDVRQMGLDERIVWMGYRPNVGRELAGLDVLLSFSKAEGLPINLIEAGWAGTAVVATQVGGVMDLIPDHRYGHLIAPEESIAESAVRLQNCLSTEGRLHLESQALRFQQRVTQEFSQHTWIQRLKSIYAELNIQFLEAPRPMLTHSQIEPSTHESLTEKLKSIFFTRFMLYSVGRLGAIRHWNRHGFRILMYHQFSSRDPGLQDALARQCSHLVSQYTPVSMTDIAESLADGTPLPPNALAVTVDDGYHDFLRNAYPVFHAYRVPVMVYLVSGFIDRELWLWWDHVRYTLAQTKKLVLTLSLDLSGPPVQFPLMTFEQRRTAADQLIAMMKQLQNHDRLQLLERIDTLLNIELPTDIPPEISPLSWEEIRFMASNGIEFGAHTRTHPILSRVRDTTELGAEIIQSKQRIEEELKRPIRHFCYPNGQREDVNPEAFKILETHQFQTAVAAEKGVNFRGAHPYWLRRMGVEPMMSKFNFEALLTGLGGSRYNPLSQVTGCAAGKVVEAPAAAEHLTQTY